MRHRHLPLAALLAATPATAQVRNVTLQPPERDFGYFLGDTITAEAIVTLVPGTTLDPHSLPSPGQISAGLDITGVTTTNTATSLDIRIEYQTFVAPEEAMQVRVPSYELAFRQGTTRLTAPIPAWSFYTSPFRHERIAVVDPAALRPDHDVSPYPQGVPRRGLFVSLGTAFAAGFLLARGRGWVPGFSVKPKPFARAAMQIANANSDNDALRALHRAFDAAAASRMLAADIPEFLQRHPHFQPLRADIELFFAASRAAFFSAGAAQTMRVPELRALARKFRRAERMA